MAIEAWHAEWKWDGIRAQLVKRESHVCIWSRGGEVINSQSLEIAEAGSRFARGTVLDGEIMAWVDGGVAQFGALQRRFNRKALSARLREEVAAYSLRTTCSNTRTKTSALRHCATGGNGWKRSCRCLPILESSCLRLPREVGTISQHCAPRAAKGASKGLC